MRFFFAVKVQFLHHLLPFCLKETNQGKYFAFRFLYQLSYLWELIKDK
jgi:hypothetical protein